MCVVFGIRLQSETSLPTRSAKENRSGISGFVQAATEKTLPASGPANMSFPVGGFWGPT